MITDFILDVIENVAVWLIGIIPFDLSGVAGVVSSIGQGVSQLATVLGALNQWFPVDALLVMVGVALAVEVGLVFWQLWLRVKSGIPLFG